ncbi:MAG: sugar kinase [Candidatus Woesearchaeota archaeon]
MTYDKVVLIKKETPLEGLLRRHATPSQVKFHLESRGESYDFYRASHDDYQKGLQQTKQGIPSSLRTQVVDKDHLSTFLFSEKDLVVVVGDSGLFVNVAKYVGAQSVICVNPDSKRYDDVFTTCEPGAISSIIKKVLDDKCALEALTMAEAKLNDGQVLYALNDLFIGNKSHVSARYSLNFQNREERQSSSGVIISTGSGSTGWYTAVMKGAYALVGTPGMDFSFKRDADYLRYVVREPFPSKITGTRLVSGRIDSTSPLKISSNMYENGVIFSDGIESDYLEFNAGSVVTITSAEKKVNLVKK